MHEIAIARQPIFDRHLETVAYELRYGQLGQARVDAEEEAGRFLATLLDTGLETLAGSRLAVVTLPASFVVEKLPQLVSTLPTEQLVLVLDPAVAQHPAGCEAVNRLVARGCQLLLDLDEVQPVPACVADVDIVRLRLPRLGHAPRRSGVLDRWLAERMADLASYRSGGVRVLVSDIRDFPAFARSRDIGADLFQETSSSVPCSCEAGDNRCPLPRSLCWLACTIRQSTSTRSSGSLPRMSRSPISYSSSSTLSGSPGGRGSSRSVRRCSSSACGTSRRG